MQEKNEARPDGIRITLRMTPQQRNLLRRAAEVAGVPVSTFVLRNACQAADLLLIEQQSGVSLPTVESLPVFTKPARQRWESIPARFTAGRAWPLLAYVGHDGSDHRRPDEIPRLR